MPMEKLESSTFVLYIIISIVAGIIVNYIFGPSPIKGVYGYSPFESTLTTFYNVISPWFGITSAVLILSGLLSKYITKGE